jgi:hypothetical protein
MNLVSAQVPRPTLRPRRIPFGQERFLCSAPFAPADAVPHRGVRRRHRLAIESNDLAQSACDARLRIGEGDPLRSNAARPTGDPSLAIDQRHAVLGPWQSIPGPRRAIAHPPGPPAAAGTFIPEDAAPLDVNPHGRPRSLAVPFDLFDPKPIETQNPSTLSPRSHASSLVGSTSREDTIESSMASGIAFSVFGPAITATRVLRGAGVKVAARRGRAKRGASTPANTGLPSTPPAHRHVNLSKRERVLRS